MAIMDVLKGGSSQLIMEVRTVGPDGSDAVVKSLELPFTSESLNPTGEFINSNAITASRSRGVGDVGNRAADGSFEVEVNYENLPWLMYAALGDHHTTGADFIKDTDDELPSYRFYVRHGSSGGKVVEFRDALVNSLRLTWASNAIMTASIDIVGLREETASPALPSPIDYGVGGGLLNANTLLFPKHFLRKPKTEGVTTVEPATLMYTDSLSVDLLDYALDWEITIDNGIDVDAYAMDSSGRLVAVPGELAISGSINLLVDVSNTAFYNHLKTLGIGSNWHQMWLTIVKDPTASATSMLFQRLFLNNIYIVDIAHDIADRGKVAYDIDFEAKYDPSKTFSMPMFLDIEAAGSIISAPPDYWPIPEEAV